MFSVYHTVRMCTTTVRVRYCRMESVRGYHDIISQPQRAPFGRSNACFRCGLFEGVRPFPSVALGLYSAVCVVVEIHATQIRSHGVVLSLSGTHIPMGWLHEGMGTCLREFTGRARKTVVVCANQPFSAGRTVSQWVKSRLIP